MMEILKVSVAGVSFAAFLVLSMIGGWFLFFLVPCLISLAVFFYLAMNAEGNR